MRPAQVDYFGQGKKIKEKEKNEGGGKEGRDSPFPNQLGVGVPPLLHSADALGALLSPKASPSPPPIY